jgi:prepilin-type N-terminal cleavage/methylation domain-containing protein
MSARRAGFTLIEMLAVMLLLGIVITAAVSFYVQLSRESNQAAAHLRGTRRSVAVLDRVARDLEGTLLVKKPESVDPLSHPWVFFAESSRSDGAADRLRFTSTSHRPRRSAAPESDLAVVVYGLRAGDGEHAELVRWTSPHLPDALDRSIPLSAEDGAEVLAEDVVRFGVRFLDEDGTWRDAWDSSSLVDASRLPLAAEIEVALADTGADSGAAVADEPPEPDAFVRQVLLPVRPLDLEALLRGDATPADGDEEEEEEEQSEEDPDCVTVAACLAAHPEIDLGAALEGAGLPPNLLDSAGSQCASTFAGVLPLPPDCL